MLEKSCGIVDLTLVVHSCLYAIHQATSARIQIRDSLTRLRMPEKSFGIVGLTLVVHSCLYAIHQTTLSSNTNKGQSHEITNAWEKLRHCWFDIGCAYLSPCNTSGDPQLIQTHGTVSQEKIWIKVLEKSCGIVDLTLVVQCIPVSRQYVHQATRSSYKHTGQSHKNTNAWENLRYCWFGIGGAYLSPCNTIPTTVSSYANTQDGLTRIRMLEKSWGIVDFLTLEFLLLVHSTHLNIFGDLLTHRNTVQFMSMHVRTLTVLKTFSGVRCTIRKRLSDGDFTVPIMPLKLTETVVTRINTSFREENKFIIEYISKRAD